MFIDDQVNSVSFEPLHAVDFENSLLLYGTFSIKTVELKLKYYFIISKTKFFIFACIHWFDHLYDLTFCCSFCFTADIVKTTQN